MCNSKSVALYLALMQWHPKDQEQINNLRYQACHLPVETYQLLLLSWLSARDSSKMKNIIWDFINLGSTISNDSSLAWETSKEYKRKARLLKYFATRILHQHTLSCQQNWSSLLHGCEIWGYDCRHIRQLEKISRALSCKSLGKIKFHSCWKNKNNSTSRQWSLKAFWILLQHGTNSSMRSSQTLLFWPPIMTVDTA